MYRRTVYMSLAIKSKPDRGSVSMLTCYAHMRRLLPHKGYYSMPVIFCQDIKNLLLFFLKNVIIKDAYDIFLHKGHFMMNHAQKIAECFALPTAIAAIKPLGNGLINHTYLVTCEDGTRYVLQRINQNVFGEPARLMENFAGVCRFLEKKIAAEGGDPARECVRPVSTLDGKDFFYSPEDGYWRINAYVEGVAYDVPDRKGLLYEAARAFGQFQRRLSDYPADTLHETIPNFHHTPTRYAAFEAALARDAAGRAASMSAEIDALKRLSPYANAITAKLEDGTIPLRVTHNDTKLNNVLFDAETDKATCVIDLDTVMPGSLLYDFGDALRFAGNRTAEDAPDLSRVVFDLDRYEEYVSGFLVGVGDAITETEREMLPLSVLVITYEQALRFMTDYLDGDVYYQMRYPEHNYDRTRAQIRLAEDILSKLDDMKVITERKGS